MNLLYVKDYHYVKKIGPIICNGQCDEIPLETMVRSNPGLILMKDGVILNKWSHRNIPGESELDKPLERLPQIVSPKRNPLNTPWGVAALFLLPLLLLGLIDRINKSIL